MGPLASQIVFESLLAPGFLAGLIMLSARAADRDALTALAPALAIALAIGTTYILAFGWPPNFAGGARSKVMMSAVVGGAAGIVVQWQASRSRLWLVAGAIGLPIWIGLPALQRMAPESVFLILPIGVSILALSIHGKGAPASRASATVILLSLAFGLAAIAAFASTFSLAELGFALSSALLAILLIPNVSLTATAALMAAGIQLSLITALLLYSQASVAALIVLLSVIGAERLAARLSKAGIARETPFRSVLAIAAITVVSALLIARIDAGAISIY